MRDQSREGVPKSEVRQEVVWPVSVPKGQLSRGSSQFCRPKRWAWGELTGRGDSLGVGCGVGVGWGVIRKVEFQARRTLCSDVARRAGRQGRGLGRAASVISLGILQAVAGVSGSAGSPALPESRWDFRNGGKDPVRCLSPGSAPGRVTSDKSRQPFAISSSPWRQRHLSGLYFLHKMKGLCGLHAWEKHATSGARAASLGSRTDRPRENFRLT